MLVWSCSEPEVLPSGQEPNVLPDEYRDTDEQHESISLPRLHCITFISKAFVSVRKKKKKKAINKQSFVWKHVTISDCIARSLVLHEDQIFQQKPDTSTFCYKCFQPIFHQNAIYCERFCFLFGFEQKALLPLIQLEWYGQAEVRLENKGRSDC